MRRIIFVILFFILVGFPVVSNAQTTENVTNEIKDQVNEKAEKRDILIKIQDKRETKVTQAFDRTLENRKEKAIREIDKRINSLNNVKTKIELLKRLSSSQKAALASQIQGEITSLNALKTKIQSGTDPVAIKTDIQSIVKSFRIYALFIPKIHILVSADRLDNLSEKLGSISGKLESRINQAEAEGKNVAILKSLLSDISVKVSDAKAQAQKARDLVIPLTPDQFPANKVAMQTARKYLADGKRDIQLGRQDAQRIVQGLRALNKEVKVSPTQIPSSPSAAVTP